ncbi:hypothetical protein LL033_26105 (plasmid) [Clostridium estertheticum]|uniref:hypothetical protein n=1 Tax=Clostridium estertheticum TaxID=238834 RepID=UPI001C0B1A22|nr:hypothetical protein [Clostridium estertheticum]MBU3218266.1 hypothetical protein [Clostridium estertheticum]WAG58226.1 hypothetical protein LL033_26105 [Clostridium estertheticum]
MRRKKNLSKAKNHISIQVSEPVIAGFYEALKDFSRVFFTMCFIAISNHCITILTNFFK